MNISSGFHYSIDFEYPDEAYGTVIVYALFWVENAYSNPDSDWEAQPYKALENYKVSYNGEMVEVDVPYDVICEVFEDKIREMEIDNALDSNRGF